MDADPLVFHLAQAVEGYAEFRLRVCDAQNVAEALEELKIIAAKLCEALQGVPHIIDDLLLHQAKMNEAN